MKPSITVVIPLYNKRQYIRRAVDSVLTQTFGDFELIVVDDGSTDGSADVLADIDDPRLRVIRQENQGGSGGQARNTAMAVANGNWFAFLDADDMWLPVHLEEIQSIVERHPDCGLVSARSIELPDGSPVPARDRGANGTIRAIDYFLEAARDVTINNASSTVISRAAFEELGGFRKFKAGEDLEYWARIALSYPVAVSDRITSMYFRGTNGQMEQLAASKTWTGQPIDSLRDLSPSVATLTERYPERTREPSVRAYINSRIYSGIKGALHFGDIARARKLAGFYLKPVPMDGRALALFLRLPPRLIKAALLVYRTLRRWRQR